ncbi:MAG: hypothetical protein AAF614_42480 [Chloroflexota bacterium]
MTKKLIIKILVSLLTFYYAYVPASADLNESHLLNPDWSPHSRVHLVWFLTFTAITAVIAIYMVWVKDETTIPALIGLGFNSGFLVAYLTASSYGGSLSDSVGEAASSGIPINLLENGILWIVFLAIVGYQVWQGSAQSATS